MLEFPRWKYVVILIVVLLSTLYALPNIYPQDPSVQITASRGAQIDDALRQKIEATLSEEGIATKSVAVDDGNMLVRLPGLDEQTRAADTLRPVLGENYVVARSEEHTSELQSLMLISYAVFCLKTKQTQRRLHTTAT